MNFVIGLEYCCELRRTVEAADNTRGARPNDPYPHVLCCECLSILHNMLSVSENQLYDVARLHGKTSSVIRNRITQELMARSVGLLNDFQIIAVRLKLRIWIWRGHVWPNDQKLSHGAENGKCEIKSTSPLSSAGVFVYLCQLLSMKDATVLG